MVEMAIRGFEVLNNWQAEVGVGDPGYVKLGYMLLVVEAQVEACRRNVDLGRQLGVDTRFASPDEIKALEPALVTDDLAGGAWEPNGGYIDVTRMVLSWLGAAQAAGAVLRAGLRGGRDRHGGRPRRGRGHRRGPHRGARGDLRGRCLDHRSARADRHRGADRAPSPRHGLSRTARRAGRRSALASPTATPTW